jgi:hypothetical protein
MPVAILSLALLCSVLPPRREEAPVNEQWSTYLTASLLTSRKATPAADSQRAPNRASAGRPPSSASPPRFHPSRLHDASDRGEHAAPLGEHAVLAEAGAPLAPSRERLPTRGARRSNVNGTPCLVPQVAAEAAC